VLCKGTVVNGRFGSIEPLTASELQLVRQHIQRKRSGIVSPDPLPLLLSPRKVPIDPLAHILSPADAPCDAAALVHLGRISGPADGAASDWSEIPSGGEGVRGEGFASSSVLVGDQLGDRREDQNSKNQNSREMPLDGWPGGHVGEGQRKLSIGWVEEGLIDVDILHTALGSYRDDGALGMAGVPMHVLGVQGRGCLVNVMDVVTHLASLCGAITRKCEEVSDRVSSPSNLRQGRGHACKRPSMKKSALTRAEARLQSAAPKETLGEIPIGLGTPIGTHVATPGGGQAARSHTGEDRCVSLRARARSEKVWVRRISLSESLLHEDIPAADLLSLFQSLCLHLSLLSNDMAAKVKLLKRISQKEALW